MYMIEISRCYYRLSEVFVKATRVMSSERTFSVLLNQKIFSEYASEYAIKILSRFSNKYATLSKTNRNADKPNTCSDSDAPILAAICRDRTVLLTFRFCLLIQDTSNDVYVPFPFAWNLEFDCICS